MTVIAFIVHGLPISQGSKNPWGGESNAQRLKPWRAAVAAEAGERMDGHPLLEGPVSLRVQFVFPRPKAHYGTGRNAGALKLSAPTLVTKAPDLDKLVRAIGDAVTGVILRDDAQIAEIRALKLWGQAARCEVEIGIMSEPLAEPLAHLNAKLGEA